MSRCWSPHRPAVQVEVRHAREAQNAVRLRKERLDGDVGHELLQVNVTAHPLTPDRVHWLVHFIEQLADRRVQNCVGVELMGPRLEDGSVGCRVVAEVLAVVRLKKMPLEQVSRLLADHTREKITVHWFDDGVDAFVYVVDEHSCERLSWCRLAEPSKQAHADALTDERRVGNEVVEHERGKAEESLARRVAIEINSQSQLRGAAAGEAARSHSDVPYAFTAPLEVGGKVHVLEVTVAELTQVAFVD